MLSHMFIGDPPGNTDRILDFSTAVTGGLFFAPSADFLDDLPDPPGDPGIPARRRHAAGFRRRSRGRYGSLGIGSLKRSTSMNNLHRELAPVSDAAWASIEAEARRTFEQNVAGRRVVDVTGPDGPSLASVGTGPPGRDRAAGRRRRRDPGLAAHRAAARPAPGAVHGEQAGRGQRGARRAGPGLAAGQGRGPADRLRRGPGDLRRLPGGRDHRGQAEHVQPGPHPACRGPRVPGRGQPGGQRAPAGRRGRPVSRCCCRPPPTRWSARPPTTATRSASTWPAWWTARSSGRPAIDGAFLLSSRGGDYELRLGQDLSIGYLSHDSEFVQLYFQESLTFLAYTAEASVVLNAN